MAAEYTECIFQERLNSSNYCFGYDIKQSDGEAPAMLEPWEMQSTSLLPSLPGPLRAGVVSLDRILFMGQIELKCEQILNRIVWNRTVNRYKNRFGIK